MYDNLIIHTFINLFKRDGRTRKNIKEGKPVKRTQSAPHRRPGHAKHNLKRQTSSEALPLSDLEQEMETNQPLISPPNTVSTNQNCEPSYLGCCTLQVMCT